MADMSSKVEPVVEHLRDQLVERVQHVDDVSALFEAASSRLRRLVPFDGAGWMSTDPGTGLPTAPSRIEQIGEVGVDQCLTFWRHEVLLDDDANLFRDLARAKAPARALRDSVGDPERSRRFREFLRPLGFDDELRAVLRAGDSVWGVVGLMRRRGRPPFSRWEAALVGSLAAPLGEALRRRALPSSARARGDRPGVLLFDGDTRLVSADDEARRWLDELPPDEVFPSDLGVAVPMWVMGVALAAGVRARGRGDGTARARIRTLRGTWLVAHAACLRDADGRVSSTVVVIEPAKAAEIAPIVVDAYGLSEREQDITRLIARGAATAEIAAELHLSVHTVRDYVKAVFAKVDVSSRGELVAKLFAEHYGPLHVRDVVRVGEAS